MSDVIDSDARRRLAELARHLASGQITNDEFEDRRPNSSERGLHDIYFFGLWPLYGDLLTHRLTRRWALTPEGRARVSRIVLFLRSGAPYRYPRTTGLAAIPVLLISLVTFGWFGRMWCRYTWRGGDQTVWPFYTRAEYETAVRNPVYLNGGSGA
jgi:hypothetical protein